MTNRPVYLVTLGLTGLDDRIKAIKCLRNEIVGYKYIGLRKAKDIITEGIDAIVDERTERLYPDCNVQPDSLYEYKLLLNAEQAADLQYRIANGLHSIPVYLLSIECIEYHANCTSEVSYD